VAVPAALVLGVGLSARLKPCPYDRSLLWRLGFAGSFLKKDPGFADVAPRVLVALERF